MYLQNLNTIMQLHLDYSFVAIYNVFFLLIFQVTVLLLQAICSPWINLDTSTSKTDAATLTDGKARMCPRWR